MSPRTCTRQPVSRRSHAGSTSVVTYQLARNSSSGSPCAQARDDGSLRRDRARRHRARGDLDVVGGHRDLATGLDGVEGPADGVGQRRQRRAEGVGEVAEAAGVEGGGVAAEGHQVEEQLGGVARRHVGELVDQQAVETTLHRQQHDRQGLGDEAGAAPGRVDRRAAGRAGVFHPIGARRGPCSPGRRNSPLVVTMLAPEASRRHTASRSQPWGMYSTQSAPRARTSSIEPVASTPVGSVPASSPASRPTLSSVCTWSPTSFQARVLDDGRAATGCRCCRWPTGPARRGALMAPRPRDGRGRGARGGWRRCSGRGRRPRRWSSGTTRRTTSS